MSLTNATIMKQKENYKKITVLLIMLLTVVLVVVMFYLMDDFRASRTSLVKKYWGGSFQCVAYVQRYYKNAFDIEIQNVGRAQELYLKAPEYGLFAHRNGGVTAPQPGDILVFGHRNNVGHVSIVTGVIKGGVLIVEQNWSSSRITTNWGKPLPMKIENGAYTLEDRAGYYVIGWVSRTLSNPGTLFDFSSISQEGWIVETGTKKTENIDEDSWTVAVSGRSPTIVSPIFIDGIRLDNYEKIIVRARIRGNEKPTEGRLYLRDKDDLWSMEVPFPVDKTDENFKEFEVDLSSLNQDARVTQLKLKLSHPSKPPMENWDIDWLRFIPRKVPQFPLN